MVRATACVQFSHRRRYVLLAVVLWLAWPAGVASVLRAQGARPIEFSESRSGSTNAPDLGAERSRLDSLESQISKSFDFLSPDESLRGAPAPLPRPPTRAPVIHQPRKKPGLFDDDEAWVRSDPLRELDPEVDEDQWEASGRKSSSQARPSLLEDGWFERKAVGDEFWELSARADGPPSSRLLPVEEDLAMINSKPQPFLENLFGFESRPRTPNAIDFDRSNPVTQGFGQTTRPGVVTRQDQFRQLLGMEIPANTAPEFGPSLGQPLRPDGGFQPSISSPWTAPPSGNPGATRSLSPVRMAEDRPFLPLIPTAPERPSVRSLYEWDANETVPTPSPSPAASPFHTPVRRDFQ